MKRWINTMKIKRVHTSVQKIRLLFIQTRNKWTGQDLNLRRIFNVVITASESLKNANRRIFNEIITASGSIKNANRV